MSSDAKESGSGKSKKTKPTNNARLFVGLKPGKEQELGKFIESQRLKMNEKDGQLKKQVATIKQMQQQLDKFEAEHKKKAATIAQEKKLRTAAKSEMFGMQQVMKRIQGAVSARLKLLGIDFENINSIGEALDASLKAINKLVAELEAKDKELQEMKADYGKMKKTLEDEVSKNLALKDKIAKKDDIIQRQGMELKEKEAEIGKLKSENDALANENNNLQSELANLKRDFAEYKRKMNDEVDELRRKIDHKEQINVEKESLIQSLKDRITALETENKDNRDTIDSQSARIKELEKMVKDKDKVIRQTQTEIDALKREIQRLQDYINRPKADNAVQTEISGPINKQVTDYPRLLKEIVMLRNKLDRKDEIIRNLELENEELLKDIEWLLKKAARFYPDKSPHTGSVKELRASPSRYLVATGSADLTVRLWRIDPEADKEKKEKKVCVIQRAIIDGDVNALAWSPDGTMLAAGTGFRNSPEGFVVVWNTIPEDISEYEVMHAMRSRPTVRFGRVDAIDFSTNGRLLFCGDVKGSLWCLNIEEESIVSHFDTHRNCVYDLCASPSGDAIFSVSHDQTLAVSILPKECFGKKWRKLMSNKSTGSMEEVMLSKKKTERKLMNTPSGGKNYKKKETSKRLSQAYQNPHRTVNDILEEKDKYQFTEYQGKTLDRNDKYPVWKVAMTSDGKTIACGSTRKVKLYTVNDVDDVVSSSVKLQDNDVDRIQSLHIWEKYCLVTRADSSVVKVFNLLTGSELKGFKSKKPIRQADFLCDSAHLVGLEQELSSKNKVLPPKMKLYQYSAKGLVHVRKESTIAVTAKSEREKSMIQKGETLEFDVIEEGDEKEDN